MQKTFIKSLLLIIAFTFALSANYIFAVWTGPTQAPPGGNTPTPVHIGATDQVKDAGLSLNSLAVFGNGFFDGNVGIGTASPQAKLDVAGEIKIGDAGAACFDGVIRYSGGDFEGCKAGVWVSLTSGGTAGGTLPFYGTAHTKEECQSAGGTVTDYQSKSFCKFSASSCPSGWTRYENLGSTSSNACFGVGDFDCVYPKQCITGAHNFVNKTIEKCVYGTHDSSAWSNCGGETFCSANLIEVGCY